MNTRAVSIGFPLGLLLLSGPAMRGQKPAEPSAAARTVQSVAAKPAGFPNSGESLNYKLIVPGGATLGEAHLRAAKSGEGWQFDFSLDISVPGFPIADRYRSRADREFCSLELEKETTHGQRRAHERTVFDYQAGRATRTTLIIDGGGHTDIGIGDCAHDGLDYIFYIRRELGLGHGVVPRGEVLFGATYSVRMEFAGVESVNVAGTRRQADHVILDVKGPASDSKIEVFFARDPAHTPLIVKAPLPLGTLSMELVR